MKQCVFCRIIQGEIPCMKVYEDPHSLVIMDIAGDVDGHMLAIPKKHVETVMECDEETMHRVMDAVSHVSRRCVDTLGYDGVNVLHASGAAAGQSVPHLHFHLIPRKNEDGICAWPELPGAKEEISAVYEKLSNI